MLVGNKCDENSLREVSELDGKGEAVAWGVSFMETSAKNNINVTELFQVNDYCYLGYRYRHDRFVLCDNGCQPVLLAKRP